MSLILTNSRVPFSIAADRNVCCKHSSAKKYLRGPNAHGTHQTVKPPGASRPPAGNWDFDSQHYLPSLSRRRAYHQSILLLDFINIVIPGPRKRRATSGPVSKPPKLRLTVKGSASREEFIALLYAPKSTNLFEHHFGCGTTVKGSDIYIYVLFPHMPFSRTNHLNQETQREWIDEIVLAVVRSICTHHMLQHHPRSYEEARTKAHVRKKKIPTTAKVYDHPLNLGYTIPEHDLNANITMNENIEMEIPDQSDDILFGSNHRKSHQ